MTERGTPLRVTVVTHLYTDEPERVEGPGLTFWHVGGLHRRRELPGDEAAYDRAFQSVAAAKRRGEEFTDELAWRIAVTMPAVVWHVRLAGSDVPGRNAVLRYTRMGWWLSWQPEEAPEPPWW